MLHKYQGGCSVEVFSASGCKPLERLKISHPRAVRRFYDKALKGACIAIDGDVTPSCRVQLPPHKGSLSLHHPIVVFQMFAAEAAPLYFEFTCSDGHARRRLVFSTARREVFQDPLHVKYPLHGVYRNVWLNLCIDVGRVCAEHFRNLNIHCIDQIIVGPSLRLRRISTLRAPPSPHTGDYPAVLDMPPGVEYVTQLFSPEGLESEGLPHDVSLSPHGIADTEKENKKALLHVTPSSARGGYAKPPDSARQRACKALQPTARAPTSRTGSRGLVGHVVDDQKHGRCSPSQYQHVQEGSGDAPSRWGVQDYADPTPSRPSLWPHDEPSPPPPPPPPPPPALPSPSQGGRARTAGGRKSPPSPTAWTPPPETKSEDPPMQYDPTAFRRAVVQDSRGRGDSVRTSARSESTSASSTKDDFMVHHVGQSQEAYKAAPISPAVSPPKPRAEEEPSPIYMPTPRSDQHCKHQVPGTSPSPSHRRSPTKGGVARTEEEEMESFLLHERSLLSPETRRLFDYSPRSRVDTNDDPVALPSPSAIPRQSREPPPRSSTPQASTEAPHHTDDVMVSPPERKPRVPSSVASSSRHDISDMTSEATFPLPLRELRFSDSFTVETYRKERHPARPPPTVATTSSTVPVVVSASTSLDLVESCRVVSCNTTICDPHQPPPPAPPEASAHVATNPTSSSSSSSSSTTTSTTTTSSSSSTAAASASSSSSSLSPSSPHHHTTEEDPQSGRALRSRQLGTARYPTAGDPSETSKESGGVSAADHDSSNDAPSRPCRTSTRDILPPLAEKNPCCKPDMDSSSRINGSFSLKLKAFHASSTLTSGKNSTLCTTGPNISTPPSSWSEVQVRRFVFNESTLDAYSDGVLSQSCGESLDLDAPAAGKLRTPDLAPLDSQRQPDGSQEGPVPSPTGDFLASDDCVVYDPGVAPPQNVELSSWSLPQCDKGDDGGPLSKFLDAVTGRREHYPPESPAGSAAEDNRELLYDPILQYYYDPATNEYFADPNE